MGIQGLLPLLKSIMVPIHIKDLEGSTVAVDTYSWLHKGALSCSRELCKGLSTSRHIDYCMRRVNLLRHYGLKPVLVFDGGLLPMKSEQENKRARGRKENLARAMEHESNGNSAAAYECYQKAVDITPSIAHELIQVLKKENISYVVAPYEADAQMTFLAISEQVDAVITEDSDLIPYGCPRIIFKMDKFGQAVQFQYSMLQQNKELSFSGFTKQMLLEMCILSGCDYLPSLPGMGLKRAHALIKRFTTYDRVIKHLRYSIASVPPLYEESFKKAILTFQHQRVYDPVTEDIVHLSDISSNAGNDLDFLGPKIPRDIAKGIAEGDLDPFTNMPFEQENASIANNTSKPKIIDHGSVKKKLDLPVQKNLLTKYFCFASLEAKRKFRAPRSSPNQPGPSCNSYLSLEENVVEEDTPQTNCLDTLFPIQSDNEGNVPLPDAQVEDDLATGIQDLLESPKYDDTEDQTRSPKHTLLRQPKHSIHRPCLMQKKEHELESAPDPIDSKIRNENANVVIRSSYFQQEPVNKTNHENEKDILKKDNLATDTHVDSVSEISSDAIEGKSRKETRKVVVRSSYFQHKPVNSIDQENKQNTLSSDNLATDLSEDSVPDGDDGNRYSNVNILKRKKIANDSVEVDNVNSKQMCTKTEEAKFGANISHLAQYSDIAEKSMEKFVSIISSFRFSSSGSRASGLRAPLKDIRNTSTKRSTTGVDFNQFAYAAPKNRKS